MGSGCHRTVEDDMFKIFKRNIRLTCIMKSGTKIECFCSSAEWNTNGNELVRINVKNSDKRWPQYILLDEIASIRWAERKWFF